MRRKLFNLATAVSVVLCVATCVLWVISTLDHRMRYEFDRTTNSKYYQLSLYGFRNGIKTELWIIPGQSSPTQFLPYPMSGQGSEYYPNRVLPGLWWKATPEQNATHFIVAVVAFNPFFL